jgi:hypothetical protein
MKYFIRYVVGILFIGGTFSCVKPGEDHSKVQAPSSFTSLRAPAYPLVAIDPYTSAWSMTDKLYDDPVRHWTGKVHSLIGAIRVDGEVYRFLGKEEYPLKAIIPMAKDEIWDGSFTTRAPSSGWEQLTFDSKSWKKGKAAFGSPDMNVVNTPWDINEIWVRREFSLPKGTADSVFYLIYSHDDDFELYLNGQEIVNTGRSAKMDVLLKIDAAMLNKDGKNVIAAHCKDQGGKAYVDFGIYTEPIQKQIFEKTAVQENVSLSATQTQYSFKCGGVGLNIKFISPLLPKNLDLLSRPVNYISYSVVSNDAKKHDVEIYFEITPQWAVNEISQEIEVDEGKTGTVQYLKTGTTAQSVLERSGDNVRIDWGHAYIASKLGNESKLTIGQYARAKEYFQSHGDVDKSSGKATMKMTETMPALIYLHDLGSVSENATSGYIMIGYDDVESIQYFGDNLKAWWTQDGKITIKDALEKAVAEFESVEEQCNKFDSDLYAETLKAGGEKYADLCLLAFRQSIAAHKLTKDSLGNILFLSKENFSNGSIGTVDVTYPSAPLFLKYNPDLLKGMMNPIFYYSESGKWKKPFAAHDVGTYPKANGQTYGEDMPVEECGNMLILAAAIAKREGNANYANEHWESLTTWAEYLLKHGLDPENQLCTDDFAGHLAHNTNLSVKAIMGIASYGMLAEMLNKKDSAVSYKNEASRMAKEWIKMADDGDHYRLTFDQAGTWSQKYNLVWDKLLGFNLFPKEVVDKEINYYLTKQNTYGLPLDNRRTYTKSDWIVWTATLADDQKTFQKFIDPLHSYVTGTPSRVPMSDWYETPTGEQVGFQARSVVGGYFIKLLEED